MSIKRSLQQLAAEINGHFLYKQLSLNEQQALQENFQKLQNISQTSYSKRLAEIFKKEVSFFVFVWLVFSIIIPFLLLFHIKGAAQAVWILPIIVFIYGYFQLIPSPLPATIFPSENYVLITYGQGVEDRSFFRQHKSLLNAWHRYLIFEWGRETPCCEPEVFKKQLDKGLFAFNCARLKWAADHEDAPFLLNGFTASSSILSMVGYFLWNLLFAWMINRNKKLSKLEVQLLQHS